MKTITIEGQLRTELGKKATRQIRSQELVPGVIYGGEKEINFHAPASAFKSIVYTPDFMLATTTSAMANGINSFFWVWPTSSYLMFVPSATNTMVCTYSAKVTSS